MPSNLHFAKQEIADSGFARVSKPWDSPRAGFPAARSFWSLSLGRFLHGAAGIFVDGRILPETARYFNIIASSTLLSALPLILYSMT